MNVISTTSLADQALVAFANLLHTSLSCSWVALTAMRQGRAVGPRRAVDLVVPAPVVRIESTGHLDGAALLGDGPTAGRSRLFQGVDTLPREAAPAGCATYLIHPLHTADGWTGLLELAWHERADPDLGLLEPLLPLAALLVDDLAVRARLGELQGRIDSELPFLRGELRGSGDVRTLTGDGPAMRAVRHAIQQVARTDSTVLILGETGTGKELVARAIHQLSPRRDRLLVPVNCAALAPSVIASELFGHEARAFTGASRRRVGRFELAHRGTLFLDEIAELAPDVQTMLLRVLQERSIERVGGNETVAIDARLIAATHQDLAVAVGDGRFRADLFYRLNVFPIHVPSLRERPEDVGDLARHFLHYFNRRMGKRIAGIDADSLRLLAGHPWPGNVRELENLVERAMIVADGATLHIDPSWLASRPVAAAAAPSGLHDVERHSILDALRRSRGRIYGPRGAAALLGVKPTTLYGKMRRHGIRRGDE